MPAIIDDSRQHIKDDDTSMRSTIIITSIFVSLWILAGIAAFVMSLVCFGRSGSTAQQVVGLLLAIFFGPLYWIYYFVVGSYCQKITRRGRAKK